MKVKNKVIVIFRFVMLMRTAKATLEVLIPQMKHINPDDKIQNMQQQGLDVSLF